MDKQLIIEQIAIIGRNSINPNFKSEVTDYIESCLSDKTPGYLKELLAVGTMLDMKKRFIPEAYYSAYQCIQQHVINFLRQEGYRDLLLILTGQEHILIGSTMDYENMYCPIGLILGELTIEEAAKARQLTKAFQAFPCNFNAPAAKIVGCYMLVSLEPLDSNGMTLTDPRPLDERLMPVPYKKSESFPCRRD